MLALLTERKLEREYHESQRKMVDEFRHLEFENRIGKRVTLVSGPELPLYVNVTVLPDYKIRRLL